MQIFNPDRPEQPVNQLEDAKQGPSCPVCGGQCIGLRGFWRCARCNYRICEECEGAEG